MAGFAKRVLDVLGYARAGQGGRRPALRHPRRQDDRAGTSSCSRTSPDASDEEALASFVKQYYARAGLDPAARPRAHASCPRPPSSRSSWPTRAARRVQLSRAAARRGPQAHGAGRAERRRDAGARAGPLAGRRGQDASGPSPSSPRPSALPAPPARIECYDISTIQGTSTVGSMVVFEDGQPRTGEYRRFRIREVRGPGRLRQPPGGAAATLPARARRRGGGRRAAALAAARPRHHRRRQGPGQRRPRGPRRPRAARPAAGRPRQGARGALPARPQRTHRPARHLRRALPAPAPARRGPPLRHHVPPPGPRASGDALGARRPARRRAGAQAGPAARLRLEPGPEGRQRRGDRRRARHRPGLAERIRAHLDG